MIRVLLVDDQSLLRMGFRLILEAESDISVIGEAANGSTAVQMTAALQPHVVLMDIRMPIMDGIQATAAIAAGGGQSKILILTTFDLDQYVFAGIKAGASGFLLKDTPALNLIAAVRTVAAGDAVLAPSATRMLLEQFAPMLPDPQGDHVHRDPLQSLTEREIAVFHQLAAGKSNREIAADLFVSEGTVKIHVGRILSKLNLRDRVQAVVLAYESGIIKPGG